MDVGQVADSFQPGMFNGHTSLYQLGVGLEVDLARKCFMEQQFMLILAIQGGQLNVEVLNLERDPRIRLQRFLQMVAPVILHLGVQFLEGSSSEIKLTLVGLVKPLIIVEVFTHS